MANAIEEKYIADLKQMLPAKRLEIGMELGDLMRDIAKSGIKNQNPDITDAELARELQKRINLKG